MNEDAIPDETTILKLRRFLEQHDLAVKILEAVNAHMDQQGLLLREGTIVGATIIQAPSSTKNRDERRDPEMRQTKKGRQWYFGMKAHIGADRLVLADFGLRAGRLACVIAGIVEDRVRRRVGIFKAMRNAMPDASPQPAADQE